MFRNVCFTLFDAPSDEFKWTDKVQYAVWQVEKCPTSNKEHIQGYVELNTPVRINTLKEMLGKTAHVEARKGTAEQASAYCKKEETRVRGPWEYGTPKVGHRPAVNTLKEACEMVKTGGVAAVAAALPEVFVKHNRGLVALSQYMPIRRDFKTIVELHIGPSGSGKSRAAWEMYPEAYPKDNTKWWDGYNGTDVVIWDDFCSSSVPYQDLLKIMDRYPMKVETKGGSVWFAPKKLVITMISLPVHFDEQFKRRVDVTRAFPGVTE